MFDFLDEITLDDLYGNQYELAECIGIEAYKKLVRRYAGSKVDVPMPKFLTTEIRNRKIISEYNGCNTAELAKKYELSERSIYEITSSKRFELRAEPIEGQLKFE